MAWVRGGEPPEQFKVSFVVSAKDHPELARFIWNLPYRGTSQILRDILSSAAKAAGVTADPAGEQPGEAGQAGNSPSGEDVSAAAAGIMQNFDKMFP